MLSRSAPHTTVLLSATEYCFHSAKASLQFPNGSTLSHPPQSELFGGLLDSLGCVNRIRSNEKIKVVYPPSLLHPQKLNASSFHTLHQPLKAKHKIQSQSGCRYSTPQSCSNFAYVPLRVGTLGSHLVRVRSRPPPQRLCSLKALSLLFAKHIKG